MSYGVQQPVYMGPIGQGAVNSQQVHGMTQPAQQQQQIAHQQQTSNQQVQQQKQHHAQAFPPKKLYKRPVEQSNVGQTRRGSSDGGSQGGGGGNVVGNTDGSGQPKGITPIVVRKKKFLAIIDPTSGKNVIDAPVSTGPSATAETIKEDDKSKSETPEVSVATPMSSVVSGIVGNGGTGDALTSSTEASTPPQTPATDDSSPNTSDIKTEFFNKISQANDDEDDYFEGVKIPKSLVAKIEELKSILNWKGPKVSRKSSKVVKKRHHPSTGQNKVTQQSTKRVTSSSNSSDLKSSSNSSDLSWTPQIKVKISSSSSTVTSDRNINRRSRRDRKEPHRYTAIIRNNKYYSQARSNENEAESDCWDSECCSCVAKYYRKIKRLETEKLMMMDLEDTDGYQREWKVNVKVPWCAKRFWARQELRRRAAATEIKTTTNCI